MLMRALEYSKCLLNTEQAFRLLLHPIDEYLLP
jgi:hypothetical protein